MPYSAHLADHFSTFFPIPALAREKSTTRATTTATPAPTPCESVTSKSPAAGLKLVTTEAPRRGGGATRTGTTAVDLRATEVRLATVTPGAVLGLYGGCACGKQH